MWFWGFNKRRRVLWGTFWILLGALILLSNYGVSFPFKFARDWPIILIAWGFLKIIDAVTYKRGWFNWFSFNPCRQETPKNDYKEIIDALEQGEITAEAAVKKIKEDRGD